MKRARTAPYRHPVNQKLHDERTFGQRAADNFTNAFGTWTYIIIQTVVIVAWIATNIVGFNRSRLRPARARLGRKTRVSRV